MNSARYPGSWVMRQSCGTLVLLNAGVQMRVSRSQQPRLDSACGRGHAPGLCFCSVARARRCPPAQTGAVILDVPHPRNGEEGPLGRAGQNPAFLLQISALGLVSISFLVPLMFSLES